LNRKELFYLSLLILTNLIIGVSWISDYGESWDEARLHLYADQSINAYHALFDPRIPVDFGNDDLRYYGSAYLVGMALLVRGFQSLFPQAAVIDLWHMGNFVCLQFGLVCFYFLARRFTGELPSLLTTILFSSQPLIWGHGFINPKDIPFMTFFLATILLGYKMLDELEKQDFSLKTLIKNPWFYPAGIVLGITISIRILGSAAGLIVLLRLAFRNLHWALRTSYAYYALALFVSFLTWPYLWTSPIENFLKSLYLMLKFQWVGQVLFDGVYYATDQLPRHYFLQLFMMQFTETALILFGIGLVMLFVRGIHREYDTLVILVSIWLILPVAFILIKGMNLYDNTRQLLFIFPSVFLIISVGLEFILNLLKPLWAQILIIFVILFPGIAGILDYHPFEYTYYNFLTVSTRQISRNYETDYWATSYKQASAYLNENAPDRAVVIVGGPSQLIKHYAREDLQVKGFDELEKNYADDPYYLVLTTRYDMDLKISPDHPPIYSVEHNGSILSVIKYIP
jgi:hypothetical protein